jgi:hypothetical protein
METTFNNSNLGQSNLQSNPAGDQLIPHGYYCYQWVETPSKENEFKGGIKACPHYTTNTFNGVSVPWCLFLNCGGLSNQNDDSDIEALVEHFGSEEKMNQELPLTLLWDQVKECGENLPDQDG